MPTPDINIIDSDINDADFKNEVAKLQKLLRYMLTKGLESVNILEVGNWKVENDRMTSNDGDVGMSTADTSGDDIRFWAGDAIDGTPKFKVTKAGILTAISAIFMSAAGYPRVELNSVSNLIAAYTDSDTYVALQPTYNAVPTLVLVDANTIKAFLNRSNAIGGTTLGTFDGEPLNLQAAGPLNLQPTGNLQINNVNGYTGFIDVVTSVTFGPTGGGSSVTKRITVNKGIITNFA